MGQGHGNARTLRIGRPGGSITRHKNSIWALLPSCAAWVKISLVITHTEAIANLNEPIASWSLNPKYQAMNHFQFQAQPPHIY